MLEVVLFPSSYFSVNKVDEDLQAEYDAAVATGLYEVAFFGYEKWFQEGKLVLNRSFDKMVTAVYRGWMMKPEQYVQFYERLLEKNIKLITEPKQYEQFHVFPNVYPAVEADTAKMLVYPKGTTVDLTEVKKHFKRFIVKDFVKSVKGTEFPRFFEASVTEQEFEQWMEVFYKYRGSLFTGGICIKEFLDLKFYGEQTNEYRVYYMNHNVATVSRNSLQRNYTPQPPKELLEKYTDLNSPFYTIDVAELADGSWKIIEAGDGQVSGLSEGQDYGAFYRSLYMCFRED